LLRRLILPVVAVSALLSAGPASASTASSMTSCTHVYSYGQTRVTVSCPTSEPKTMFYAVAYCPNVIHIGPKVLQGGGRVSVATCANPMANWGVVLDD
jgi:hypothetical protein